MKNFYISGKLAKDNQVQKTIECKKVETKPSSQIRLGGFYFYMKEKENVKKRVEKM